MLDVKRNRLDYGRLLIPPDGFSLQQAIATCYSVDLDTLLSIPVALYYAQTMEGGLQGRDVQLIRAIQHTSRLLTIYHQEGQVKVPHAAKDIYAYFEDALAPVLPIDAFTSFHPKVWVLRYEHQDNPDNIVFRLLVLSRNLTFDRCWDVAAYLEGEPTNQPIPKNTPLVDFLDWLCKKRPFSNARAFLDELTRVRFQQAGDFSDFKFHPIGIPGYGLNPVATRKSERLLCLSPFLHPQSLEAFVQNTNTSPLILSRRVELERIPQGILRNIQSYCLSDVIVDGERLSNAEEGAAEPMEQDLHAKLFLFDQEEATTWFLGSANATKAAFERNVEFMIELKGSTSSARLRTVRKELLGNGETEGIFVQFNLAEGGGEDEEENRRRAVLRSLEYAILVADIRGEVTQSANQLNYDLTLKLDLRSVASALPISVAVRPLVLGVDEQTVQFEKVNVLAFANISETSLSRFVHVTIREGDLKTREFLVRIEVDGIPSTRLDNIFKSIINSRDKFFTYLRFLLTDELSKEEFDVPTPKLGDGSSSGAGWDLDMPIFEQLLVTASRNPSRLVEVDRVIASLQEADGKGIIPAEFLSLWEVFKAAVPSVEAGLE